MKQIRGQEQYANIRNTVIVFTIIVLSALAIISLQLSRNADIGDWSQNVLLNFGTEMIGGIVTFIAIGIIVGRVESQKSQADLQRSIQEGVVNALNEYVSLSKLTSDKQISQTGYTSISRRLVRSSPLLINIHLLWIDDFPNNNIYEMKFLRDLGIHIDTAVSSEEAERSLASNYYDLVLSDIGRGDNPTAGTDFMQKRASEGHPLPPVIFYSSSKRHSAATSAAFGITNYAEELFHLVIDVIERIR